MEVVLEIAVKSDCTEVVKVQGITSKNLTIPEISIQVSQVDYEVVVSTETKNIVGISMDVVYVAIVMDSMEELKLVENDVGFNVVVSVEGQEDNAVVVV